MHKLICDHCQKELPASRPEWSQTELRLPGGNFKGHLCKNCVAALRKWFEGQSPAAGPSMAWPANDVSTIAAPDEGLTSSGRKRPADKPVDAAEPADHTRSRPSALAAERS